jgi:hypothetical protein
MANWLFDYMTENPGPLQAGPLHDAAALAFAHEVPNPMGQKGDDGCWTNGRILKRAADRIPLLEPPRHGKRIERFRDDNRWYWQLLGEDVAFGSPRTVSGKGVQLSSPGNYRLARTGHGVQERCPVPGKVSSP